MKHFQEQDLPNYGIIECDLEQEELDHLWKIVRKYSPKAEWDGNRLISLEDKDTKQWTLEDDEEMFQQKCLMPCVDKYLEVYGVPFKHKTSHYHQLALTRLWCRASNQGDYQSLHDHQGIFTFVVWLKIPFDAEEERSLQPGFRPEAADFVLVYPDTCGQLQKKSFVLGPTAEGKMLFFPSDINHIVYPHYTTKEYRLSIAGDVVLSSIAPQGLINPVSEAFDFYR